jgi:hypothetical protein
LRAVIFCGYSDLSFGMCYNAVSPRRGYVSQFGANDAQGQGSQILPSLDLFRPPIDSPYL